MNAKSVLLGTALTVVMSVGSVQAAEKFMTLGDNPAAKMTAKQTEAVRGANHVIRLVEFRTGQVLPSDSAIAATTRAGSIDGAGQDRPKIVGLLP